MSTKIVKINRGDSYEFNIDISNFLDDTGILTSSDVVYFALMFPHQLFEKALLIQGYTQEDRNPATGEITVKLEPNDTRCLAPGVYYYTVKLQRGGTPGIIGDFDEAVEVRTIIERTKFIVNE